MSSIPGDLRSRLLRAFAIDYRSLAAFRVALGSVIALDVILRSFHVTAFLTDAGVAPRASVMGRSFDWSVYFLNGSTVFAASLLALTLISALSLIIGYRTRLATIACWVLMMSVQMRYRHILDGADQLIRVMLFWSMFLPLGARFSLDAAVDRNNASLGATHFSIPGIAILVQAMHVYWMSGLLKTHPQWTEEFSAIWRVLHTENFTSPLGHWFGIHFEFVLPFLTAFVLYLEIFAPLLIFTPVLFLWLRLPTLFCLFAMHIGFLLLLQVGIYPFVSMTTLLLFLPPEFWNFLHRRRGRRGSQTIEIFYDKECGFCLKTVLVLKTMLCLPQVRVAPAQEDPEAGPLLIENDSWVVRDADGETRLEWKALVWLVAQSPVFFWLRYPLTALGKTGDRIYHWIGDRRMLFGKISSRLLPFRNVSVKPSRTASLLVACLAALVFYTQLSQVTALPWVSPPVRHAMSAIGLKQAWGMFAPFPINHTSWPVVDGFRSDGTKLDLYRGNLTQAPLEKPDRAFDVYGYHRWKLYYRQLRTKNMKRFRQRYAWYQCKRWNLLQGDDPANRIVKLQIRTGIQNTRKPPNKPVPPTWTNQGVHECPRGTLRF